MTKPKLTDRQRAVYDLIQQLIRSRGYGPTVREIGEQFGIKSPNGVMCHLRALEKKGLINRRANKSRAIELTGEHSHSVTGLPWAGIVTETGREIDLASTDVVDLGKSLASESRLVIQVSGDSLIRRGIRDGDYVVIDQQQTASDGDLALVRLQDRGHVLRYYHHENGHVVLKSANDAIAPIHLETADIDGVAVATVRLSLNREA
ncbi:MAG: transcriptional repressor LexA [Planctomycetota bacterium]